MDTTLTSFLTFGTPLMAVVALLLLVPASLAQQSRLAGAVTLLGGLLLTTALMLLLQGNFLLAHFTVADGALTALMLLGSGIAIAPLADRARPASLMLIAPIAAYSMLMALFSFGAASPLVLAASIIALTVTALIGSAFLPAHPARYTATGQLRSIVTSQASLLSGWVLLAASFIALTIMLGATPDMSMVALSAVVAALITLLTTRAEDGLGKAGEAITAAVLLASCASLTAPIAILLGITASFCVNRSEAIASSLRIDDPQHFIGALLMPAIGGILDTAQLATHVTWLALAIGIGIALSVLLWPLVMLLTGLALPKRRVSEGVRA